MSRLRKILFAAATTLALLVPAGAQAAEDFSEYGLTSAGASLSTYQAGAHADFTTAFALKSLLDNGLVAQTREIFLELPPGMLGDPTRIPSCTMVQLGTSSENSHCPQDSQIGITEVNLRGGNQVLTEPIYNMTPPGGDVVARFGFMAGFWPVTVNARVRSESDYGVTASLEGVAALEPIQAAKTTIWGVPGDPSHDLERITPLEASGSEEPPPGGRPSGVPPAPFLSNPTRCGVVLSVGFAADSYQLPEAVSRLSAPLGPITGCGKLSFEPTFSATPTTREAAAPSGLDVDVAVPQDETPLGLASSHLRDAVVSFPEGMTIAAGAADGLGACSGSQAGYKTRGPAVCPDSSKLGSAEFDVPGLERPVQGAIYQRTPEPGHLFRVWIVADDLGVHVALPGEIDLDPVSGRITSTFLENPQVPVRALHLRIFGGPRGPLATPTRCGTYFTHWELSPWSGTGAASDEAPMTIDQGCGGGGFSPGLSGGTSDPRAGSFASLLVELTRAANEQNISSFALRLPQGLIAKPKGVTLCEGAAAASGSCPADSRIGYVRAASGPGSSPLWIPQPGKEQTAVYLSGPYKGAPYGFVVRVPAQAGPFDLGTVVTRGAIRLDPETAEVTVETDPLPRILEGVPITYRTIYTETDRPNFTLNPTDCSKKELVARVASEAGAVATPSSPFQATSCASLGFQPQLKLKLSGATGRTGHPALHSTVLARKGDANLARATVILPATQFIDNAHISNPCTRVQFAADACPAKSILGTAKVQTPLLNRPLAGNVYFRSNGGDRLLPDIVIDLRGEVHFVLVGFVDSVVDKKADTSRIRTTFKSTPDAPFTRADIDLFGGKRGLLVNSTNLCAAKRSAKVELLAQNGRVRNFNQVIANSCAKGGGGKKKKG
jgi:hypothetical protein